VFTLKYARRYYSGQPDGIDFIQTCARYTDLPCTLVAGFDLMEFPHTLTERCVELLEVDAAGLLLADSRGAL
jgi:hypothetical protein